MTKKYGNVCALVGGQWGDEGKGKLVDILAEHYDYIVRATGGANAGHTVYLRDPIHEEEYQKYVFHLIPSGVLFPHTINLIGNGCVVHLPTFFEEMKLLKEHGIDANGRLFISDRAHLVFEYHKIIDGIQETGKGKNKVGTTGRGIGPAYTDKVARIGIRVHEMLDFHKFEEHMRENLAILQQHYDFQFNLEDELAYYQNAIAEIKPFIRDTALLLNNATSEGKKILLEGANATLLDIDHGTYPYVTSSNASIGGIMAGSGIGPKKITSVIGVMKAYCTRVGAGPFPTEQDNDIGQKLRTTGGEFGATTGRPRRCGWFDAVAAKYAVMINGFNALNVTKLDVLDEFDTVKIATDYFHKGKKLESFPASTDILQEVEVEYLELPGWKFSTAKAKKFNDLPENAQLYVQKIAEILECPVDFVGVGIARDQMLILP